MRTVALVLAGFVGLATAWARANEVEFAALRADANHDGTPDGFRAEIEVSATAATQVRMYSDDWSSFEEDGDQFRLESSEHGTLADLLGQIAGTCTLEITTPGNVSTYQFTIGNDEPTAAAGFPDPIPEITGVGWSGNTARLWWDWSGDPGAVGGLGVEAGAESGGTWLDVYEKTSLDDPPDYVPKTALSVDDIVFPAPPPTYDEIAFLVAYGNLTPLDAGDGAIISGWTHTGGDELFGGQDDQVYELMLSLDFKQVVVPEPAGFTLALLGLLPMSWYIRQRRNRG